MSVPPQNMPPQGAPAGPPPQGPPQAAAPQGADAGGDKVQAMLDKATPGAKVIALECSKIIDEDGEELVETVMQGAKSVAIGMSQVAFAIITGKALQLEQDASAELGEDVKINLGELIGVGGPGEYILARLFGVAEQMGIEGATDEGEYDVASDALDMLLDMAQFDAEGGQRAPDPAEEGAPAGPPPPGNWREQA